MTYLWQKPEWPSFNWSSSALLDLLVQARFEQGRLLSLPSNFVHSFELSDTKTPLYKDLQNTGLSLEKLFGWQASLYPTGYAGVKKIKIAELRTKDLFRNALPPKNLNEELQKYLHWWQEPPVELDPVLRSALSFFWFMLISPFEDGNFELACGLCELALQEQEKTPVRTYDIAVQLEENSEEVFKKIEQCSLGHGDITAWLIYYLQLYLTAVRSAYAIADKTQNAALFWSAHSRLDLNQRQRKVLNLLLDENIEMTNRQYVEICKTSRESAKRDLAELLRMGLLAYGSKKGRSVSYLLNNN
jgi:Fic family protein